MPLQDYKAANNAQGVLLSALSAAATTLTLGSGQGALFPASFPYPVEIREVDTPANNYRVLKREIATVTNKSGDTLTITRATEACPSDYLATTQEQTARTFSNPTNTIVTMAFTAAVARDIYEEIARKASFAIPDMRGTAIGNPGTYLAQKYTTYEFRPATGADVGRLDITGSISAWFCLETISAWVWGGGLWDWNYLTQLAWSVHSSTFELYSRKATSGTTWGAWKKQLPWDWLSLDYSLVPEYWIMAIYDHIPYTQFSGGANKKITKEWLELNFVQDWCTGTSSSQSTPSSYGWTSSVVAVPKGGIAHGGISGIYNSGSSHPNPTIQWSADGSTGWTTIITLVPGNQAEVAGSGFVKPGYTRYTSGAN